MKNDFLNTITHDFKCFQSVKQYSFMYFKLFNYHNSRDVSRGNCGLRKFLGSLSANNWDRVPALLVIWPEAFGVYKLLNRVRSWCQNVKLQEISWIRPDTLATNVLIPRLSFSPHPQPHLPGTPSRPTNTSGPGAWEVTGFALGLSAYKNLCGPSKSEVSVSPSPVEMD